MEQSIYFHSLERGCQLRLKRQTSPDERKNKADPGRMMMGGYCMVHKVDVCRCGWEWTHHGDKTKLITIT